MFDNCGLLVQNKILGSSQSRRTLNNRKALQLYKLVEQRSPVKETLGIINYKYIPVLQTKECLKRKQRELKTLKLTKSILRMKN